MQLYGDLCPVCHYNLPAKFQNKTKVGWLSLKVVISRTRLILDISEA